MDQSHIWIYNDISFDKMLNKTCYNAMTEPQPRCLLLHGHPYMETISDEALVNSRIINLRQVTGLFF